MRSLPIPISPSRKYAMNIEDLRANIDAILNPEPDQDLPLRDIPHPKLRDLYGLDVSYLETVAGPGRAHLSIPMVVSSARLMSLGCTR